jgi:branched-chain amino acid transport system permease protein
VKGPYLALVTMAFPLILLNLAKWVGLSHITGAEGGISHLPRFFPFLPTMPVNQQRIAEYYLVLLLLVASAMILHKIANSKTGIVFVSILDNELASKASGINVSKYKLMAFAISGLFASLAGSVKAHLLTIVNPATTLELTISFTPIIVTILGGLGTIYGPIIGAYIYYIVDKYVLTILIPIPSGLEDVKLLVFTLIVVVIVIKWPRGIARFIIDKLEDLQEARELEERGKHIWKREKKK